MLHSMHSRYCSLSLLQLLVILQSTYNSYTGGHADEEIDPDENLMPPPINLWTPAERSYLEATPFSSAEVERTFSVYKAMDRDNRQSFHFQNFRQHVISKCILQKVRIQCK